MLKIKYIREIYMEGIEDFGGKYYICFQEINLQNYLKSDEIKSKVDHIFNNEVSSNVENIYGDGKTGEKIVKLLSI